MSHVVILGAGDIGGALARQVAASGAVSRVVLVDAAGQVAEGKALDIQQAAAIDVSATRVDGTTDIAAVVGASAIVFADRHGVPADEWQEDAGLALLRRVHGLNGRAPMLCAGARQVTLIDRGVGELSVPHLRLFGSAPEALRAAIMSLVALEAACAPSDVSIAVLGRPPGRIVVPWESASLGGRAAADVLSPPALVRLEARLSRLWPPGPLTLAAAAARVLLAACGGSPRTVAAFVASMQADDGSAHAAMLPVTLGPSGIVRIATPQLTPRDRVRVDAALRA